MSRTESKVGEDTVCAAQDEEESAARNRVEDYAWRVYEDDAKRYRYYLENWDGLSKGQKYSAEMVRKRLVEYESLFSS